MRDGCVCVWNSSRLVGVTGWTQPDEGWTQLDDRIQGSPNNTLCEIVSGLLSAVPRVACCMTVMLWALPLTLLENGCMRRRTINILVELMMNCYSSMMACD